MGRETFILEMEYGSPFQKDTWGKMIRAFLEVTKVQMKKAHSKNQMEVLEHVHGIGENYERLGKAITK